MTTDVPIDTDEVRSLATTVVQDRLIDATIGLDDVNAGFDALHANATVRQICVPHG